MKGSKFVYEWKTQVHIPLAPESMHSLAVEWWATLRLCLDTHHWAQAFIMAGSSTSTSQTHITKQFQQKRPLNKFVNLCRSYVGIFHMSHGCVNPWAIDYLWRKGVSCSSIFHSSKTECLFWEKKYNIDNLYMAFCCSPYLFPCSAVKQQGTPWSQHSGSREEHVSHPSSRTPIGLWKHIFSIHWNPPMSWVVLCVRWGFPKSSRKKLQASQRKQMAKGGIKIPHISTSKFEVKSLTYFPLACNTAAFWQCKV